MTTKETESEMLEIFMFKAALTDKITYNIKFVHRLEMAARNEKDRDRQLELKREVAGYKKVLQTQKRERAKLSGRRIALQLGVSEQRVKHSFEMFSKRSGQQGLSFKKQQELLMAIKLNREKEVARL